MQFKEKLKINFRFIFRIPKSDKLFIHIFQINWLGLLQKLSGIDLKSTFQLQVDFLYVKELCDLLSKTEDDVIGNCAIMENLTL